MSKNTDIFHDKECEIIQILNFTAKQTIRNKISSLQNPFKIWIDSFFLNGLGLVRDVQYACTNGMSAEPVNGKLYHPGQWCWKAQEPTNLKFTSLRKEMST
jgi:hypothetical protein